MYPRFLILFRKVAILFALLLCLSIPITTPWAIVFLVFSLPILVYGKIYTCLKRWSGAVIVLLIAGLGNVFMPGFSIHEGHNLFLPAPKGSIFKEQLPAEIYDWLERDFLEKYPKENHCLGANVNTVLNCWKTKEAPLTLFSSNADGVWQNPKYSRTVEYISFQGLSSLRAGFINRSAYNWYDLRSDVKRSNMPYFVMFEFPPNAQGYELCWQGKIAWVEHDTDIVFLNHKKMQCQMILNSENFKIYGNGINNLKIEFPSIVSLWVEYGFKFICGSFIILLLVQIPWSMLILPYVFSCTSLCFIAVKYNILTDLPVYSGGLDGLTHDSFSHLMLDAFLKREWISVIDGGTALFYYMPGLRYFRFIEHLLFGETVYGYLIFLIFLPFVIYSFLRFFIPSIWLIPLFIGFYFTPFIRSFGLSFVHYSDNMANGFPGTLGYCLFLLALVFALQNLNKLSGDKITLIGLGLVLAFAVFMRPNLAPGAAIFLGGMSLHYIRGKQFGMVVLLAISFSPILLVPVHNWYFGGVFVPFTTAATAAVNLHAPPLTWGNAVQDIFMGRTHSEAVLSVVQQLELWSKGWNVFHLFSFVCVVVVCVSPLNFPVGVRLISWIALAQHSVLWIFTPHSRYAWLAWLLSFVVTVVLVRMLLWQILAPRFIFWNKLAHTLEPQKLSSPPLFEITNFPK